MKLKRNDPCHCGSDKKFKDCHGKANQSDPWKKMLIYGAIALVLIWFIMDLLSTGESSPVSYTHLTLPTIYSV